MGVSLHRLRRLLWHLMGPSLTAVLLAADFGSAKSGCTAMENTGLLLKEHLRHRQLPSGLGRWEGEVGRLSNLRCAAAVDCSRPRCAPGRRRRPCCGETIMVYSVLPKICELKGPRLQMPGRMSAIDCITYWDRFRSVWYCIMMFECTSCGVTAEDSTRVPSL